MVRIGVDVGGTFTDVIGWDGEQRVVSVGKVLSTIDNQSRGFIQGLESLDSSLNLDRALIVHGTTTATNALLERKGAKLGLITTQGFRDLLELRRRDRPLSYGLRASYHPLVDRRFRLEVSERVGRDGSITIPVDVDQVLDKARTLIDSGVQAIGVVFFNSYLNPVNERRACDAVRESFPDIFVTASTELLPEQGEFERTVAASLNGYVGPVLRRYFNTLHRELSDRSYGSHVLIIQSNGGAVDLNIADAFGVQTLLSGPAAGVHATQTLAVELGLPNVIAGDMGGTSFDVSIITNGRAATSAESEIEFGLPLRLPAIDINTIGAGGGSIARLDEAGVLSVGPESAGSNPGPAAYGRGGHEPTVTDADVILGRLRESDADRPIELRLDYSAAYAAVEGLARRLNDSVDNVAWAIAQLADEKMALAIRRVSIEKGYDPSDFALMCYGGAGPLHGVGIAERVGIKTVVIPPFPGLHSAVGCLQADIRHDASSAVHQPLAPRALAKLNEQFDAMESNLLQLMVEEDIPFESVRFNYAVDMAYRHQLYHITVPVERDWDEKTMHEAFEQLYRQLYSNPLAGGTPIIINARVSAFYRPEPVSWSALSSAFRDRGHAGSPGRRGVTFHPRAVEDTKILSGFPLKGEILQGPAIIELSDSTVVIPPQWWAETHDSGALIMTRGESYGN